MSYKELATQARLRILEMVWKAQTSHIASNFSVIDIATVLYEKANLNPYTQDGHPDMGNEDFIVWSKGWAAASIYYFLAKQGKIPKADLDKFQNERYLGLAETSVPGVYVNGGSVGHGLSVAVGMALGKKRARQKGTVFCILSDGELNEGSTWEAVMMASHHKLSNLVAIIDKNGWQAMGRTGDVCSINVPKAFEGFGWDSYTADGHNHEQIEMALLGKPFNRDDTPYVIVADTIKGKGVSFFEDHLTYHYKNLSDEEYERAKAELV